VFELVLIANAVNEVLAERDVVACIVTQGTFTAEETACFLNYVVNSDKPVIVCASQRTHGSIGNDGDRNLLDAVRVAIDQEARGKGVMLVMNEEILPAREVTKSNQRPDGFVSSGGSSRAIGAIEDDQVTFYYQPLRKHTFKSDVRPIGPVPFTLPRVDIIKAYAGADAGVVEAILDSALKEKNEADDSAKKYGIVVEGLAFSGIPTKLQSPALEKAVTKYGIPVASASRGDYGRVPRSSGHSILFISCDNLMAVKARLLLMLAIEKLGMLTPYTDPEKPTAEEKAKLLREIQAYQSIFDTH
jgi:L-asparaginase